jgi:hypothetical protein
MLAMDETFGTMFQTMLSTELGPGFTVNLQVRDAPGVARVSVSPSATQQQTRASSTSVARDAEAGTAGLMVGDGSMRRRWT